MSDDPGDPGHLLVVEDNPGDVRLIEETFDDAGLETTLHVVSDGENALDFVHHRNEYEDAPEPDMVLTDWNLPQMDGDDLVGRIEVMDADIVTVIMTGSQTKVEELQSNSTEADACMSKPAEPAAYVDVIRSLY